MRLTLILFLSFNTCFFLNAQIEGRVLDKNFKSAIADVWLSVGHSQTISDAEGKFYLKVDNLQDALKVICSHPSYHDTVFTIAPASSKKLTVLLSKKADTLAEITVRIKDFTEKQYSTGQTFTRQELEGLSGPLSTPDLLRSIQVGTGVLQAGEMDGGLFVRGSAASQSVVLLQDIPVFNPAHLLGLTNSIDPDALSKATFYKGDLPTKIGGWLSGYVLGEARSNASLTKEEAKISLGALTSDALVLTPLPNLNTNIVIKARTSYMQLVTSAYNHLHESKPGFSPLPNYSFGDWTVQTNTRLGSGQLTFMYFQSRDNYRGTTSPELNANWGNQLFSLKWKQPVGSKGWFSSVLGSSIYKFRMDHEKELSHNLHQAFQGYFLQLNYGRALAKNRILETGLFTNGFVARSNNSQRSLNGDLLLGSKLDQNLPILGVFGGIEEENTNWGWKVGSRLNLIKNKLYLEPRTSLYYNLKGWELQGFYDKTYQFHHKINVLGISMPFDFFVLIEDNIPIQSAHQLGFSLTKRLGSNIHLGWNVYNKWLKGQPNYHEGLNLFFERNEKTIEAMKGMAYGSEFNITFKRDRLMVYTGYTISETWREIVEDNGAKTIMHPPFDVRHQLNINTTYQLNSSISLSAQWFYQSGAPTTYPVGIIPLQGLEPSNAGRLIPAYGEKGNVRMPATHRLDLSISYTREKIKSTSVWNIGVYNAYNQTNPYFLYYDILPQDDGTGKIVTKQRALLPVVPTIRYSLKFKL